MIRSQCVAFAAGHMALGGGGQPYKKFAERIGGIMTIEVAVLISIVSVAFSIFFGLKNNKRSDTKDIEARASERAEINIKLNHIASTTQEIKDQISSLVRDVQKHGDRLTKVEEGVKRNDDAMKRLHERIDNVEDRLNKEGKNNE